MKPEKPAGPSFVIQNGAAVKTKPIDWLWPGMLARGKVHVLAGRGGMGKTTLMLKVAATISNGGFFPDCQVATDAGNVLYISGEDDAGDTLIPRFRASGGEPERIFLMNGLLTQDGQFLSIVDHHKWFEDEVKKNEASLLILDPATEFCGTTMDNNSAIHVRAVIGRLQQIAEVTHAAIVCLTHLTKRNDGEQVSKVLGSGAWTHAPRIVWGVDENEGSKYLGLLKSNISPMDHVYPYNLSPSVVDGIEAHHVSIGRKVPGGYFSDYGDLAETQKGQKIITATEFLRDRLMDRSAPKQTIVLELTSHGISESTITRAARELGVVSDRSHKAHGPAVWSLP